METYIGYTTGENTVKLIEAAIRQVSSEISENSEIREDKESFFAFAIKGADRLDASSLEGIITEAAKDVIL